MGHQGTTDTRATTDTLPLVSPPQRERLLGDLLRGVSRSFYLTLRVLPKDIREPVGVAYLLARAADTIADTRLLPPERRLRSLLAFREQLVGPVNPQVLEELGWDLAQRLANPSEQVLLVSLPQVFSLLEALPDGDLSQVRSVVVTLTCGMEMDLTAFPPGDSGRVTALKDLAALDQYTYFVAGCVGEFWTAVTVAHTPGLQGWDLPAMSGLGVRFGKALQLTNVLRDVPKDLRLGRCYLPEDQLTSLGLVPRDLLDPQAGSKARPVLVDGIRRALDHFAAAEEYVLAIPRRSVRLRLAVLWPVLIGLATLAKLARNQDWLDPDRPARVSRRWVYRTMALSWPAASWNGILSAWIRGLRQRVEQAL
ncbi:MAG: squalene/phytoene synthase family protein [Chloroflexi bacterium]|nr:squalene/phytoene synthase family protein [Chloroflexota bacterium]